MRNLTFFEIWKRLERKPKFKRKLKIFAIVGLLGFFMTSSLAIWTGVAVWDYFSAKGNLGVSSGTSEYIENLRTRIDAIPNINARNCWDKAQSLIGIEPWLARPLADNLVHLKVACLEAKRPSECIGSDCDKYKIFFEGDVI